MENEVNWDKCFCDTGYHDEYLTGRLENSGLMYSSRYTVPPWVTDGVMECARTAPKGQEFYDQHYDGGFETFQFIPLTSLVADFYLLDYVTYDLLAERPRIKSNSVMPEVFDILAKETGTMPEPTSIEALSVWSAVAKHRLVMELARYMRSYCHLAISRELSHHTSIGYVFTRNYTGMPYGWAKLIEVVGGAKAASYAFELYSEITAGESAGINVWKDSFGGWSWAHAAEILMWFERGYVVSPREHDEFGRPEFSSYDFLDRIFSLQHNTGSFLNKASWMMFDQSMLSIVLDAHAHDHTQVLLLQASPYAQEIFINYVKLLNSPEVERNLFRQHPRLQDKLRDYSCADASCARLPGRSCKETFGYRCVFHQGDIARFNNHTTFKRNVPSMVSHLLESTPQITIPTNICLPAGKETDQDGYLLTH